MRTGPVKSGTPSGTGSETPGGDCSGAGTRVRSGSRYNLSIVAKWTPTPSMTTLARVVVFRSPKGPIYVSRF